MGWTDTRYGGGRAIATGVAALALMMTIPQEARGQALVRVPADTASLAEAVRQVDDGGVVEVAPGVYPSPSNGWRLRSANKAFTVRAASPGTAILDGGGERPILQLTDGGDDAGRPVRFEGIVFADGRSTSDGQSGGVSVQRRRVTFVDCIFRDNAVIAPSSGGGAVRIQSGSDVAFVATDFLDNRSKGRGGAVEAFESQVLVTGGEWRGNRTNFPGHDARSVGGALYAVDSRVRIRGARFIANQTGYAGSAIFFFGRYESPLPQVFELEVSGTRFEGNIAQFDPCCPPPGAPQGAIHVEDRARLLVRSSVFEDNEATWGAAINSYRVPVEIFDSVLIGNVARRDDSLFVAAGGAVMVVSNDKVDPSTEFGSVNRPTANLLVRGTTFAGRAADYLATQGGCVAVFGDHSRQFGEGGVSQQGGLAQNRSVVELSDVVFHRCRVTASRAPGGVGGGAFYGRLVDVTFDDVLVLDGLAEGGSGGGLFLTDLSTARLRSVHLHGNEALEFGGAINATGSHLDVSASVFANNRLSGVGPQDLLFEQTGVDLFLQPNEPRGFDLTGLIAESIFVGGNGLAIFEGDSASGVLHNEMRYDGNSFHTPRVDDPVILNTVDGFGGADTAGLNRMIVARGDGSTTRKTERANRWLAQPPASGSLVAAPSQLLSLGALESAGAPSSGRVGYSWTGNGTGRLNGTSVPPTGLASADPGEWVLSLSGGELDREEVTLESAGPDCSDSLCLSSERFAVEVEWRDFAGQTGRAEVVPFRSDDSGLLWFFDSDNWEMLVKVLDGCALNDRFWVFAAATTNVEYTLTVTERATGVQRTYENALGVASPATTDTEAFACAPGAVAQQPLGDSTVSSDWEMRALPAVLTMASPGSACVPAADRLCLGPGGRYAVEVTWRDFAGNTGVGRRVDFGSADSGLFWFFDSDNWEMLVKVLDGCAANNNAWVFGAATTDVEYTLNVTDTVTGRSASYSNTLGSSSAAIVATGDLPCS